MLTRENVAKIDIEIMSDCEVVYWFKKFAEDEQAEQMRKHMFDQVEIRDASSNSSRILPLHADSAVVE